MTHDTPPRIRCRLIGEADIESVIDLLSKGFPRRTRAYWEHSMQQLARHEAPAAYPRFGYVLEDNGTPVGVVLLIIATLRARGEAYVRCNGSGWYVDPAYRGYASLLLAVTHRYRDVTYTNLEPSKHTWPIIDLIAVARKLRLGYVQDKPLELDIGINLRSKGDFMMSPEIKSTAACLVGHLAEQPAI
jgi:hypothetical protein